MLTISHHACASSQHVMRQTLATAQHVFQAYASAVGERPRRQQFEWLFLNRFRYWLIQNVLTDSTGSLALETDPPTPPAPLGDRRIFCRLPGTIHP
jgi:hypothetical protein